MKRRKLLKYAGSGLLASVGLGLTAQWQTVHAQNSSVTIKWLGHTSFLFTGGGRRLLFNPFRRIGCTAGYRSPSVETDLVMISSRLFDEGYLQELPGDPQVLSEPGIYEFEGLQIQGILTPHDREGGRRFGENIIWKWNQGGMTFVHMGGAAAPIEVEQQILIGRPDVLLVPIGGGPKAYTAEEAAAAVQRLRPKLVIPTHYRTQAADPNNCDISGLNPFLEQMSGVPYSQANSDTITLQPANLPAEGMKIQVMGYSYPAPVATPQAAPGSAEGTPAR